MTTESQIEKKEIHYIQLPPILHYKKFADLIGVSHGVVRGWIDRDELETIKIGRYNMINIEKLRIQVGI
jgi:DNA-binding transcriptional regulator YiaG